MSEAALARRRARAALAALSVAWAAAAAVAVTVAVTPIAARGEDAAPVGPAPDPATAAPIAPRAPAEACDALLILSGGERGLMIPCGCTFPQRGGLPRRAAVVEEWRALAKASAAISVGDTLGPGIPAQNDHKADLFRCALETIGYAGTLLSADDLSPFSQALSTPRGRPELTPRPPLNVKLSDHGPLAASATVDPTLRFTIGDLKARAVSVVDPTLDKTLVEGLAVADAVLAPAEALKALAKEPGLLIVAAHVFREDLGVVAREAAEKADLVVIVDVAGEAASRTGAKGRAMDKPLFVTFDDHGKDVGLVRLSRASKEASGGSGWVASWSAVPLDPPYDEGESALRDAVDRLFPVYRRAVRDARLLEEFDAMADDGASYVGTAKCATCHEAVHASWEKTPHAHAFATLEAESVDSWADPECVGCHTVGWSRDRGGRWLRAKSGFRSRESTPDRTNVQCEACHGPGSAHAADPKKRLRLAAGKEPGVKAVCFGCHDLENSNGFNAPDGKGFERYLPQIDHSDVPKDQRTNKPR